MAAFKREELRKILGDAYTDDIGAAVISLHRSVLDPLKDSLDSANAEVAKYKQQADKLPGLQTELDALKAEDYKSKYEQEHKDFEAYKSRIAQDAQTQKLKAAYKTLLSEEKISDKAIDSILNATDYSKMKLKADGTLDGVDELKKAIGEKWGGFRVEVNRRGAGADNPPPGGDNGGQDTSVRDMIKKLHESRFGAPPQN